MHQSRRFYLIPVLYHLTRAPLSSSRREQKGNIYVGARGVKENLPLFELKAKRPSLGKLVAIDRSFFDR